MEECEGCNVMLLKWRVFWGNSASPVLFSEAGSHVAQDCYMKALSSCLYLRVLTLQGYAITD